MRPLTAAVDLALLPLRALQAVAVLPQRLVTTAAELRATREVLTSLRPIALELRTNSRALVQRSDEAIARMDTAIEGLDRALAVVPDLLDTAEGATDQLTHGVVELQEARQLLGRVTEELPAISRAAEGLGTIEAKLGLVP